MRAALATAVLLALTLTGCQEGEDDRRSDYCAEVEAEAEDINRTVAEGGAGAFIKVLPPLEDLAEKAPGDIRDEWQVFLNALRGLRDALEDTGVKPDEVKGELPPGLPAEDRRRIQLAASVLAGEDVRAATQGIEQHALDVCHTPLL